MVANFRSQKQYTGPCRIDNGVIARTWWGTTSHPERVEAVNTYLKKAHAAEKSGDIYGAMCYAGSARSLYSSAQPQEAVQKDLYKNDQILPVVASMPLLARSP